MARYIYDSKQDKMVPAEEYYFEKYMEKEHLHMTVGNQKVSINYIPDEMAPTQHMCSGKYFTSKKKFRNETKAYNCIEVGNETKTLLKSRKHKKLSRRERRNHIKKAINDLKWGNAPRSDQLRDMAVKAQKA